MVKVTINQDKCSKCYTCLDVCPMEVFVKKDDGHVEPENEKECVACRACEAQCPESCITVED